jgi:hypothetical protein
MGNNNWTFILGLLNREQDHPAGKFIAVSSKAAKAFCLRLPVTSASAQFFHRQRTLRASFVPSQFDMLTLRETKRIGH